MAGQRSANLTHVQIGPWVSPGLSQLVPQLHCRVWPLDMKCDQLVERREGRSLFQKLLDALHMGPRG